MIFKAKKRIEVICLRSNNKNHINSYSHLIEWKKNTNENTQTNTSTVCTLARYNRMRRKILWILHEYENIQTEIFRRRRRVLCYRIADRNFIRSLDQLKQTFSTNNLFFFDHHCFKFSLIRFPSFPLLFIPLNFFPFCLCIFFPAHPFRKW